MTNLFSSGLIIIIAIPKYCLKLATVLYSSMRKGLHYSRPLLRKIDHLCSTMNCSDFATQQAEAKLQLTYLATQLYRAEAKPQVDLINEPTDAIYPFVYTMVLDFSLVVLQGHCNSLYCLDSLWC